MITAKTFNALLSAGLRFVCLAAVTIPLAAHAATPQRLQITNVTNKMFAVHWVTSAPEAGSLIWGTDPAALTNAAYDVRGASASRTTHYVKVTKLYSQSTYYFKVVSGGTTYGRTTADGTDEPYAIRTTATLSPTLPTTYLSGQVNQAGPLPLIAVGGDEAHQVSAWSLDKVTASNSDNFILYWTLKRSGSTVTVRLFKSNNMTDDTANLVACGSLPSGAQDGSVWLNAANNSGITGTVQVAYTQDDPNADGKNTVTLNDVVVVARIRDGNGKGSGGVSAPQSYLVQNSGGIWMFSDVDFRLADGPGYFQFDGAGDKVELSMDGADLGWAFANVSASSFKSYPDFDIVTTLSGASPIPVVDGVQLKGGGLVAVTGLHFAAAEPVQVDLVDEAGRALATMRDVSVLSDTMLQACVPADVPEGDYYVRVAHAGGVSEGLSDAQRLTIAYPPPAPVIASPSNGLLTNAPALIVSGTAKAGATVTLYDGAAILGEAAVDAGGAWSLQTPPLGEGLHALAAEARSARGMVSPLSSAVTVTVDTIPPGTPVIASPSNGSLTAVRAVTLSGTAESNVAVRVYDGASILGETATGSGTTWRLTTAALPEGPHTFTAFATDAAGNVSASSPAVNVVVDVTPPPAPIILSPANGTVTADKTPALSGAAEAGASVQIFDGSALAGSVIAGGTGGWTFTASPLSNGAHAFAARAVDAAGNVSAISAPVSVTVSAGNGSLSILIAVPTASPAYASPTPVLLLGGSASDDASVKGVTWRNEATGVRGIAQGINPWSAALPLTAGTNPIRVWVWDVAGNSATATIEVAYTPTPDAVPPTLAIADAPAAHIETYANPLPLGGIASDQAAVSSVKWKNAATGGDGTAEGTDAWIAEVPLAAGSNAITVVARDPSGNATSATVTVEFTPSGADAVPPAIALADPAMKPSVNSGGDRIRISGAAGDDVALATVVWSNEANGQSGTAEGLDAWSATVPLAAGRNGITVRAFDASGNSAAETIEVAYGSVADDGAPQVHGSESRCGLLGIEALALLVWLRARRRRP